MYILYILYILVGVSMRRNAGIWLKWTKVRNKRVYTLHKKIQKKGITIPETTETETTERTSTDFLF